MGTLLGQQLVAHWRGHILPGLTVAFLTLVLFLAVTVGPFLSQLAQSVGTNSSLADVHVTSATDTAYALEEAIADVPGVDGTYVSTTAEGQATSASEFASVWVRQQPPSEFDPAEYLAGVAPQDQGEVALSTQLAKSLDSDVGDRISISLASDAASERSRQYTVSGIYNSPLIPLDATDAADLRVSSRLVDLGYPDPVISDVELGSVEVRVTPGASIADVEMSILEVAGTVTTPHSQFAAHWTDSLQNTFSDWLDRILAFTLLPMILTILTLASAASNSLEGRTWELRYINALGATRSQLVIVLIAEHLIAYAIGAVIGLTIATATTQGSLSIARDLPGGDIIPNTRPAGVETYVEVVLIAVALAILSALPAILSSVRRDWLGTEPSTREARTLTLASIAFVAVTTTLLLYLVTVFATVVDTGPPGFAHPNAAWAFLLIFIAVLLAIGIAWFAERKSPQVVSWLTAPRWLPLASLRSKNLFQRTSGQVIVTVTAMIAAILCVVSTNHAQIERDRQTYAPYDMAITNMEHAGSEPTREIMAVINSLPQVTESVRLRTPQMSFEGAQTGLDSQTVVALDSRELATYFGESHPYTEKLGTERDGSDTLVFPSDYAEPMGVSTGDRVTARVAGGRRIEFTVVVADVPLAAIAAASVQNPGPVSAVWLRTEATSGVDFINAFTTLTNTVGDMANDAGGAPSVVVGKEPVTHLDVVGSSATLVATLILLGVALIIATASSVISMLKVISTETVNRNLFAMGVARRTILGNELVATVSRMLFMALVGIGLGIAAAGVVTVTQLDGSTHSSAVSVPAMTLGVLLLAIVAVTVVTNVLRNLVARRWRV